MTTIHFVQNVATPHNTDLLEEVRSRADVRIVAWYWRRTVAYLPWPECADTNPEVRHLEDLKQKLRFVALLLTIPFSREQSFVIVGYSSPWSRLALLSHWLLGKDFGYWTDLPQEENDRTVGRRLAFFVLRQRARPLFVVGDQCRAFFTARKFDSNRLVNLPVSVRPPVKDVPKARSYWREHFGLDGGDVFLVAASRLVFAKGYDVLVNAVSMLPAETRSKMKLIIVGEGPERGALLSQIRARGLTDVVIIDGWRSPDEYSAIIAAADVYVHPARFDAFGGGTLHAMALGIPTVATTSAGSARERITNEINGFLCPPDDADALSQILVTVIESEDRRIAIGTAGAAVARQWTPSRCASILVERMLAQR